MVAHSNDDNIRPFHPLNSINLNVLRPRRDLSIESEARRQMRSTIYYLANKAVEISEKDKKRRHFSHTNSVVRRKLAAIAAGF